MTWYGHLRCVASEGLRFALGFMPRSRVPRGPASNDRSQRCGRANTGLRNVCANVPMRLRRFVRQVWLWFSSVRELRCRVTHHHV